MWHEQFKRITLNGIILCLLLLLKGLRAQSTPKFQFGQLTFSRRLDGYLITNIYQISLKKCLDECAAHAQCQSINYFRRMLRCELNSNGSVVGDIVLSPAVGYVYQEILSPVKPSPCTATSATTVSTEAPGTHLSESGPDPNTQMCSTIECPILSEPINGYINGNMNSVGSRLIIGCDVGYMRSYPRHATLSVTSECQQNGTWSENPFDTCYEVTCKNLYEQGHLGESGNYSFYDKDSHGLVSMFCDYDNATGIGYTYFEPTSLANLRSITNHMTEKDHVIIRHLTVADEQRESMAEELTKYKNVHNVSMFLSNYGGSDYNRPDIINLNEPYLYLSFVPNSDNGGLRKGTTQGYRCNENDVSFINSDDNKNNYIVLSPERIISNCSCCCDSTIARAFFSHYLNIETQRQMDQSMYYQAYVLAFGGSGTKCLSCFEDKIKGIAFGLPFRFTVVRSNISNSSATKK